MSPSPCLKSLLLLLLLLPLTSALKTCYNSTDYRPSKAVYSNEPNFRGACGYTEYGATVNNGDVTGVGRLFRNGRGCGACYHVRCSDARYCNPDGLTVVITDQAFGDASVDFVLSSQAFGDLAYPDFFDEMLDLGIVDVEYRRVSCKYPAHNLIIKVMQESNKPGYLSITFLYQGGQYDVLGVEVALTTDECSEWIPMRHNYGAVWDLDQTPSGSLNVRLLVYSDPKKVEWVEVKKPIPANWRRGAIYDTGIQLYDDDDDDATSYSIRTRM